MHSINRIDRALGRAAVLVPVTTTPACRAAPLTPAPTALPNVGYIYNNVAETSQPETVTISNTGGIEATSIVVAITGAHPTLFAVSSTTCTSTLNVNQACTISVTASPAPAEGVFGLVSASLQLSYIESDQIVTTSVALAASVDSAPTAAFLPGVSSHRHDVECESLRDHAEPASVVFDALWVDTSTVQNFDFPLDTALLASWTDSAGMHSLRALPAISSLSVNVVAAL